MKSLHGTAASGESFELRELREEPGHFAEKPRAAPAPGVPVSEDEYKRLKEAARHTPAPRNEHAQEDRPKGRKGKREASQLSTKLKRPGKE